MVRSRVTRPALGSAFAALLVLAGGVALVAANQATPPPPAPAVGEGPGAIESLAAMNEQFRAAYRRARAETRAQAGPVILVRHDRLTLIDHDNRREAATDPALYHRLKEFAHVPLAIFVRLAPWGEGPIDAERLADLRRYRETVAAARPAIEACGFGPAQVERQRDLVGRSLAFLDATLAAGRSSRPALDAFARGCAPLVLANAAEAATAQIEGYEGIVSAWKRDLGPEAWGRLRVVIVGRQLPRRGNVAVQYFARRLGVPGEGPRLVYAEELSGDDAALDLLGTHLLDREIGRAFFDDPARMERDLLSDGAADDLGRRDFDK